MSDVIDTLNKQLQDKLAEHKRHLDSLVTAALPKIAFTEKLVAALTSRGIPATAHASMEEDGVYIWTTARAAAVTDIEAALERADIRVVFVQPYANETVIYTEGHPIHQVCISHADIPAPAP